MLWTLFAILLFSWILGFAMGAVLGGYVHLLLVLALFVLMAQLLAGRHAV